MPNTDDTITEEELAEFLRLREIAIAHRTFAFPLYQAKATENERLELLKRWKDRGWIRSVIPTSAGKWVLAEEYRPYAPGETRVMTDEELRAGLVAARASTPKSGMVRVLVFESLAPRITFLRLVDAGIIKRRTRNCGSRIYELRKEYRE